MGNVPPDTALTRPADRARPEPPLDDQAAALDKLIALAQQTPPGRHSPLAEPGPASPAAQWPEGWSAPARTARRRLAVTGRVPESLPPRPPAAQPPRRTAAWALNDLATTRTEGPEAWLSDSKASSLTGQHRAVVRGLDPHLANAIVDIRRMSGGLVEKVLPIGPVLAPDPQRRKLRKSTFGYVLSPATRALVAVLSLGWAACLVSFWVWWLQPSHRITLMGELLNSVLLVYVLCYPAFFIIAANRLRNIRPSVAVPLLRAAFVVTRAPSEPWGVACGTLTAMLGQDFPLPYDVWLCDERPTAEIVEWCNEHGVMLASRNGVDEYHRATWPRRSKCKEGNLAYFYDYWGYRYYDVVAQLDCDHRPSRTYLTEMVRPFSDPAIGYVAAPSVCDANAAESWSARGRLYREASFHGAFQLGHSDGWGPTCIGSHYAVRTRALRDIGGIGPELAEDFSTSFLLNTAGWHGAFAIDAEAHGDGPNTFSAMLVQEFQWSRSLTVVLLGLVPRNISRLSWGLRFRFFYSLIFYFLLVVSAAGGLILAPVAAATGRPWMNVNYPVFLAHWWSISIWLILLTLLLRRKGMLRPRNAPILSWENWLYTLTRWPYIAWGIFAAFLQVMRPRPVTFKVTPKAAGGLERFPLRLIVPFLVLCVVSSAAAVVGEATNNAAGYVFLCIAAATTYAVVSIAVPLLHASEAAASAGQPFRFALWKTARLPLFTALLGLLPVVLAAARYPVYLTHVFPGWAFWL
jgi:cellulose synthase (UDP-forming)